MVQPDEFASSEMFSLSMLKTNKKPSVAWYKNGSFPVQGKGGSSNTKMKRNKKGNKNLLFRSDYKGFMQLSNI